MEKNSLVILTENRSDTYFTSFFAKWTQTNPTTFSIVKPNSDFGLVNKSLDFELNSPISNGQSKREHQQTNSENFNNGRSNRSETTESTNVRQCQQRGRLLRRNSRDESVYLTSLTLELAKMTFIMKILS